MGFFKYCYSAALTAWLAAIIQIQINLLPTLRQCALNREGVRALESATGIITAAKECLNNGAITFFAAIIILTAFLLITGIKKGYIAKAYDYIDRKNMHWILVAAITAIAALPYLSKGSVLLGDGLLLSAATAYMKESLLQFTYPFWTPYWYSGTELFPFYASLYPTIAGAANILLTTDTAQKILLFALHTGSALLAYKAAKTITKNSDFAIISGIAYGLSLEHIGRIMIGRLITSFTYLLLPILFIAYEMNASNKLGSRKFIAITAITSALLLYNHQTDGLFMLAAFTLYAALRTTETKQRQAIKHLTAAMLLALLIISFWAIPMIIERSDASGTGKLSDIANINAPNFQLAKELLSWPGKWGERPAYYIGISLAIIATTGIAYLIKNKKYAIPITTAVIVMLALTQTTRYMPAIILMLSISAAYGLEFINKKGWAGRKTILAIAIAVLLIDMLPATTQLGYPDFKEVNRLYRGISASDGERVLDLTTDRRTFWPTLIYLNNRQEAVFGVSIEAAPKSFPYAAAIAQKAAEEIYDKQEKLSEKTLDGLYLLGAKKIIIHNEQKGKNPKEEFISKKASLGLERNLSIIELQEHSLLIAAPEIETAAPSELEKQEGWYLRPKFEERTINRQETDTITEQMRINRKEASAKKILVKSGSGKTEAKEPKLETLSSETKVNKAAIKYNLSEEAYVQASYSHYNNLAVKIDGKETQYQQTATGTIAFRSAPGVHELTIEGKKSPLRKATQIISLAGAAIAALLIFKRKNL